LIPKSIDFLNHCICLKNRILLDHIAWNSNHSKASSYIQRLISILQKEKKKN